MRVLLTGAAGQLGQALVASCPVGVTLLPSSRSGGPGQILLDLADPLACRALVLEQRPDAVLNAGAYTAVDQAEQEPALAQAVNAEAPAAFADALATTGGQLLQLSTDFVFNGRQGSPYTPEQPVDPLGVYGATKAAGEAAALGYSAGRVLRTSWVYGPVGRNFCLTLLRLHQEKPELGVVADQVGCPTATHTLAAACWRALERGAATGTAPLPRLLHWSDAGAASWYDFAVAIGELGLELSLLSAAAPVQPLTTAQYPTPARRPPYSLLECSRTRAALGLEPLHWRQALRQVLARIASTEVPTSVR